MGSGKLLWPTALGLFSAVSTVCVGLWIEGFEGVTGRVWEVCGHTFTTVCCVHWW